MAARQTAVGECCSGIIDIAGLAIVLEVEKVILRRVLYNHAFATIIIALTYHLPKHVEQQYRRSQVFLPSQTPS